MSKRNITVGMILLCIVLFVLLGCTQEKEMTLPEIDCDFCNADLTGCQFEVHRISKGNFILAKLNGTSF